MPRNVSRYPCSGCHLEVRPRQEAISCDRCHRWRHRLCNTGMNRPEYREMTKKIKEGVEVSWICPDCRIRNFTSDFLDMEPSIAEQPIADHEEPIADQHADHEEPIADQHADQEEPIADQHTDREEPITDQPDMDFDVNRTIDDSVHPMEPSLQEEQITDADIPEDRPVQYTIVSTGTQRERSRLHDSLGYMYTVKRKTPRGAYWWCSVRGKTVRCPATVIQAGADFKPGAHPHCHAGNPGALVGTKVRVEVKKKALLIKDKPALQIVEDVLQDIRTPDDHQLPNPEYEKRILNRKRAAVRPPEPTSLDFVLDLSGCDVPNEFLQGDVRVGGARHLVFASADQLRLLADARTWYVDATFKVVRAPFYQLLSVHAFLRAGEAIKQVPLAFALMSRRRREDYEAVLQCIKERLPCQPDCGDFVCDFEAAIWGAARSVLPGVHVHGCTFHWCQAVYRQACQLGLQTAYQEKGQVYKLVKALLALPYLPRRHIPEAFEEIAQRATECAVMQQLLTYIDQTWMKSSVWAVANWAGFRRVVRTNNDTEGWHRRINTRAGRENLQLYVLLPLLHREAKLVTLQYQLVAENRLTSRSRGSQDKQKKLHEMWDKYEEKEMSTSDFLRACAGLVPF